MRVGRLRYWLHDGQYGWSDRWPFKTFRGRYVDPVIDAQERWIEKPCCRLVCRIWGHQPTADCSIPEHDFCACCGVLMPGSAHREMA